jgi:O-antigen/teichoic acid export membrane protein
MAAKLVSFVYFLLLARWLDVAMFGILTYAATVAVLADTIADLGMGRVILRDVARAPHKAARLVRVMVPPKLIVALSLYAAMAVLLSGRFDEPGTPLVFAILGIGVAATGAAILLEQVLHAHGRFGFAAASHFVPTVVQLAAGALLYAAGGGAPAFAAALVCGTVAYLGIIVAGLRRIGVPLGLSGSVRDWLAAIAGALPFAAVTALLLLSLRVEFFVLGQMADAEQVGWFGSAARLFEAALTVPFAFGAVATPRLVQAFAKDIGSGEALYAQFARVLTIGAAAIALAGIVFAGPAVELLLPAAYAPATPILVVLLAGYPVLSLHLLNVSCMLALPSQRRPALLMCCLLALQAAIAVPMIAGGGGRGAATAFAVSAGLSALASSVAVRGWLTRGSVLPRACAPALAGGICAALPLALAPEAGLATGLLVLFGAGLAVASVAMLLPLSPTVAHRHAWKTAAPLND